MLIWVFLQQFGTEFPFDILGEFVDSNLKIMVITAMLHDMTRDSPVEQSVLEFQYCRVARPVANHSRIQLKRGHKVQMQVGAVSVLQ